MSPHKNPFLRRKTLREEAKGLTHRHVRLVKNQTKKETS